MPTSAKDDDAGLPGRSLQGGVIHMADVIHDVYDEPWVLVGVEEQHVAD